MWWMVVFVAGCGNHYELLFTTDPTAVRMADDRVKVTATVVCKAVGVDCAESTGLCLHAMWAPSFASGAGGPYVDDVTVCHPGPLTHGQTDEFVLTSTKPLPPGANLELRVDVTTTGGGQVWDYSRTLRSPER